MRDLITIAGIIRDEPAVWVALMFTIFLLLGIWYGTLVTRARHEDVLTEREQHYEAVLEEREKQYNEIVAEREWWRNRAGDLEDELDRDHQYRERVIRALEHISESLYMLHSAQESRWFRRWRP